MAGAPSALSSSADACTRACARRRRPVSSITVTPGCKRRGAVSSGAKGGGRSSASAEPRPQGGWAAPPRIRPRATRRGWGLIPSWLQPQRLHGCSHCRLPGCEAAELAWMGTRRAAAPDGAASSSIAALQLGAAGLRCRAAGLRLHRRLQLARRLVHQLGQLQAPRAAVGAPAARQAPAHGRSRSGVVAVTC